MKTIRPYYDLVKSNHNYRRLWLSQIVANFGDWFGLLAVYTLILKFTDSELLLGLLIVLKMISYAIFSPFAGYLVDRFDRKRLMIGCDLGRAFIVLGYLFVQNEELLWIAFTVTSIQMMMASVFEPAKSSSIPNITSGEELVRANVLSNLSWSVIFTTGMAIGGFAAAYLGTDAVFIINAATYILSAVFIRNAVIPHIRDDNHIAQLQKPIKGIVHGFRFLFNRADILRAALAKGTYEIGLGGLVYVLILISENVLLMGSIGLGLLYGARGIGTAIGPLTIRGFFGNENKWISFIGICMLITGLGYFFVGFTDSLILMLILVMIAHAASGANWVMSTILIQKRAPDTYRGRVFSAEWLFFTLCESVSVLFAALMLEFNIISLETLVKILGGGMILLSIIWGITATRFERLYISLNKSSF